MNDQHGPIALQVSQPLFELATECVRLHSNALGQIATLDRLVTDYLAAGVALADGDAELINDHLSTIPSDGPILVTFALAPEQARELQAFGATMATLCRQPLSRADTLSVLLFLRLVDHKARVALAALDRRKGEAPERSVPDTVVTLRR